MAKAKRSVSGTNCVKVTTRGNQKQCSAPSLTAKDRQEGAWYLFHVMLGVTFARVWYIASHKQWVRVMNQLGERECLDGYFTLTSWLGISRSRMIHPRCGSLRGSARSAPSAGGILLVGC